jgi:hypothetical protein
VRRVCAALAVCLCLSTLTLADRIILKNGAVLDVDEVWRDIDGYWFRRGNVTEHIDAGLVRRVESAEEIEKGAATAEARKAGLPSVWIYLVGGARVQADEAREAGDAVWLSRGNLTLRLDRSRVEHIERGEVADASLMKGGRFYGWTTGSARLDELIRRNGARYGVDPYLIFCVMEQESHFSPKAVSPAGARGLMQLMPGTAARFGVRRPHDPAQSVMGGTRYLKELLERFDGHLDLVLAGYNAGEGAVASFGHRVPPYAETRRYVRRVGARYRRKG